MRCLCWSAYVSGLSVRLFRFPSKPLLMAHENIVFVSVCQMFNTLVKLGGALLLLYLEADRLRIYAVIMACLPFLLLMMEGSFLPKEVSGVAVRSRRTRTSGRIQGDRTVCRVGDDRYYLRNLTGARGFDHSQSILGGRYQCGQWYSYPGQLYVDVLFLLPSQRLYGLS